MATIKWHCTHSHMRHYCERYTRVPAPPATAVTESTREDQVQGRSARCSCVQASARYSTVVSQMSSSWFRDPETPSICFLTVAKCPSYTAVHRRRSDLSCCCRPYLEQLSLPQRVTSASSMSVFRGRLKAFLFRRSFSINQSIILFVWTDITEKHHK